MKWGFILLILFCTVPNWAEVDLKNRPSILIVSMSSMNKFFIGSYGAKNSALPIFDEYAPKSMLFKNALNRTSWRNVAPHLITTVHANGIEKFGFTPVGFKVSSYSRGSKNKVKKFKVSDPPYKIKLFRYQPMKERKKILKEKFKGTLNKKIISHIHIKTHHIPYIMGETWKKLPKKIRNYLERTKNYHNRIPFLLSLIDEKLVYEKLKWKFEENKNESGFREVTKRTYLEILNQDNLDRWKNSPTFEKDLAMLKTYYLKALKETNEVLRYILDDAFQIKKRKKKLLILMGAHGESFMENGFLGHGKDVTIEENGYPLLIYSPGLIEPKVHEEQFNDEDIAKFVLMLLRKKNALTLIDKFFEKSAIRNEFFWMINCQGDLFALRWKNQFVMKYYFKTDSYELFRIEGRKEVIMEPTEDPGNFVYLKIRVQEELFNLSENDRFRKIDETSYCPVRS